MIPENKKTVVEKALQTAFGVSEFGDIQQLTKGLSGALIFKITVHSNPYLLRVITRTDAMADPSYYFETMKIAAQAGIAPPIYYLDSEDRISITGFINEKIFPADKARDMFAGLLHQLHSLPKFPYRINYFNAMESFITKFLAAGILPENFTKDLFQQYESIAAVYPRNDKENWVSCHNDLKPENIIFDGQRPWLIDWEGAFLNDRYLDLAIVGNFVAKNDEDETEYLEKYFGQPLDEYKKARFFIMSLLLHVYYFTFFMLTGTKDNPPDINNFDNDDFDTFHARIWHGETNLSDNLSKQQYAGVHRKEFFRKIKTKRFSDSMQVLSGHESSANGYKKLA